MGAVLSNNNCRRGEKLGSSQKGGRKTVLGLQKQWDPGTLDFKRHSDECGGKGGEYGERGGGGNQNEGKENGPKEKMNAPRVFEKPLVFFGVQLVKKK